jgi:glycosyltransferase involved in cell wall biosynthesis
VSDKPLVSILMAACNAEPWVAQAVESALAQTWPRVEIIVVDDGSTDGTRQVLARYEKRGVRVLTQPNRGQSVALNAAFRASSGAFIKFFDADDLLSADNVERQMTRLSARPGCIATGEWGRFRDDPSTTRFVAEPVWRDMGPADWLVTSWGRARPMLQCGLFLIPRSIIDQGGGWDERLTLINDFEFFTRSISHADEVLFAPESRDFDRSGLPGSVSGRRDREALESGLLSLELGTAHLIRLEDSARTRRVSANLFQDYIYTIYPEHTDLQRRAAEFVRRLGGADLGPDGPPGFQALRRVVGWKLARRIQQAATRRGLNRSGIRRRMESQPSVRTS